MKLDARTAPIHAVLENYLKPKDLAYALRLWSEQFIEQPNLSLKTYVESFYARQPISLRSHELYNELLPAMLEAFRARVKFTGELIDPYDYPDHDFEGMTPVPTKEAETSQEPTPPASVEPTPKVQVPLVESVQSDKSPVEPEPVNLLRDERYEVFSFFMRTLCNRMPLARREKLFAGYASDIQDCCIYPVGASFFEWLKSDGDYFEDKNLEISDMSSITHVLYMGMCDYLGPVEADAVLTFSASAVAAKYPHAELDINSLL